MAPQSTNVKITHPTAEHPSGSFVLLKSSPLDDNDDEDEEDSNENPYADPNYPELEFVDYSDPEYQVDQGTDEYYEADSTEAEIEAMREERRRRNDEFQFQTYFKNLLREGEEYRGEWSVYQASTFMEDMKGKAVDANGYPRLLKTSRPIQVVSKAYKSYVETKSEHPTDAERIRHVEMQALREDDELDDDIMSEAEETSFKAVLESTYWPEELSAFDFRGEKGIMCVGNAYTICTCQALKDEAGEGDSIHGPFAEYRAEVGLLFKNLRFRVKLDYRLKEDEKEEYLKSPNGAAPALHLKTLVVCREMLGRWPPMAGSEYSSAKEQVLSDALHGKPGAEGGLYDPPPVGEEDQAGYYMLLDLEGGVTLLFPYEMSQDPDTFKGNGWVTSFDWAPGTQRYQVDRKVQGGLGLRHLRTLELSEVQSADAEQYRPRDGGADMRQ